MKRTQIYLPYDLYAQLQASARQADTSVSEVIRRNLINEVSKKRDGTNVLLDLAKLSRKWKIKAPKDLSQNLDYYLYGPGSPQWGQVANHQKKSHRQTK